MPLSIMEAVKRSSGARGGYYHGTAWPLEVKKMCGRGCPRASRSFRVLETLLEARRPSIEISRCRAIYMVRDPRCVQAVGGHPRFIYEMAPQGHVTKAHTGWLEELSETPIKRGDAKVEDPAKWSAPWLVDQYWRGANYPLSKWSGWEYLAHCALVLRRVVSPEQTQ